jgi:ribosomal protein L19E
MSAARRPGHRAGERHPRARHTDATVQQARALRDAGLTYVDIGRRLGVHWRTVCDWTNYATRYRA